MGANACRQAIRIVSELSAAGRLASGGGQGARVIYAQTDSLFVLFPEATAEQALDLGKVRAQPT
jgi:hypothetical protein